MIVTSVKSIKYLHSTAHEALAVWQLDTEEDKTPTLHVGGRELTGPGLATVHGFKGSRDGRQTSEDAEHYALEAWSDVAQVWTTPLPPPRWPRNPRMAGPADTKWRQHNIYSVETSYS